MEYYARSPWSTVWTLNVDDTFEAAYRSVATESMKRIQTLNWDDEYRQGRELNVVHLHGVVDQDALRKLVFSLSQYAGAAATPAAWPVNFRDSYGNSPFVIIGARMRDEPDIEAVIRSRRPTHAAPSFYVSKTISAATRDDLIRWGLVPVELSAEDFVLEWGELTGLDLEHGIAGDEELAMRVGHQFTELNISSSPSVQRGHDFLGGDEPLWSDIENHLAAELEWVSSAKADCDQIGQTIHTSTLIAYTGKRLTGRSTGLLQVGYHLRAGSWRTFLFRGSGRIDKEAILGFASNGKSLALLFDGVAAFVDDVDQLVADARSAGLSVICVAVDDSHEEANIVGKMQNAHLAHHRVASIRDRLSSIDANRLVDSLARVGRLGIIDNRPDKGRVAHFRGKGLFSSMADLENAPGFGRRVGELLVGIEDPTKEKLVLVASYASLVNHDLLVIDAARMAGLDSDALVRCVGKDSQLSSLLSTDGTRVWTRHRWMALEPLVGRLGAEAAAEIVRDGIRSVSGRLGDKSRRERNPTALLIGAFMSRRNLTVAFAGADLDVFYESLLDVFGSWSGRYWEQRAILARRESVSDESLLAKAESFAIRATDLLPDTYSFTTLGTVLLEKAARAQVDVDAYYDRAYSAFEKAASFEKNTTSFVTWLAFLEYSIRVLERLSSSHQSETTLRVQDEFRRKVQNDWVRAYTQIAMVRDASDSISSTLLRLSGSFYDLRQADIPNGETPPSPQPSKTSAETDLPMPKPHPPKAGPSLLS
ncbi:MAG: SIR2 family protein [Propionibacteriaceae bacterium]|nr:SIR2 family protein [Propionibacteriaceae bacterium]